MSERYYVAELDGYRKLDADGTSGGPGLTVQILDRAYLHRVVWIRRTEDLYPPGNNTAVKVKRRRVRELAAAKCAELNAEDAAC